MQKSDIKFIFVTGIKLLCICALIALLVSTVNFFTAPLIEKNNSDSQKIAIQKLFGDNIGYSEITIPENMRLDGVQTVYNVFVENGSLLLGYCVKLSPNGFKGPVDLLVSISSDFKITGVEILSTNDETVDIGTKVAEESFTSQFIGLSSEITDDSKYIIAGATKTSKPVTHAISNALVQVKSLVNGGIS